MIIAEDGRIENYFAERKLMFSEVRVRRYYLDWPGLGEDIHYWVMSCGHICAHDQLSYGCCKCKNLHDIYPYILCKICKIPRKGG